MQEQQLNFDYETDVVVIGAGNAAMCAAISAREQGAGVIVLEKSPEKEKGGNTTYTHGSIRFAYNGADEIRELVPDLDDAEMAMTDFGSYTEEQFYDDMCRMTDYKTDPVLASILTDESFETMKWMTRHNVKWIPIYGRQAFKVDGVFKFWGGMVLESVGGGHGLVEALHEEASSQGVQILYKTMAVSLLRNDDGVYGVVIRENGKTKRIAASSVIIASGGFHANTEMRSKYLGTQWDAVHVRGSRYNTGDGIRMALDIGALPEGNWTLSHAVMGDRYLPDFEEGFQRLSYPFGILVNANGERFLDEGADFRNYTYAKYGRELLKQPDGYGYQVFDAQTSAQLREEYKGRKVTKVKADTLEELADKMDVDRERFLAEVKRFNESVDRTVPFNPNVKDGRRTIGLDVPKTNWATPIEEGPFEAYAVTCGITFTFGGLKINEEAEVQDTMYESIPGLYAAGEAAGGLFYSNYPGGAGLMAGSVFGKIAGANAAEHANQRAGAKAAIT
ncbi:Fumarate reductase flavoprotein subunit precursor [Bhargavaea cecembensis DSE10]|uniref:Fumarate reductase flavoprotein subunit n=1 Tax=Bhargavaea cecembensis DSE10 TaxID=1235279 RepID=M7NIH6_9BACL|nr:FAD-dependent tricarballylate dehydrogenase TcuA [Bhargavaea cecembensis]EMR06966.1 Fumarate reductase flavoprotein subunit precursor [Bhargavaea cecembensis DSE10]